MIDFVLRLFAFVRRILSHFYWSMRLKKIGCKSHLVSPLRVDGSSNIEIGSDVIIEYKTWLAALPLTGSQECILKIENGVAIGHFNHIYATKKIVIEENVLIADRVYISDNLHDYRNINVPVKYQPILQNNEVIIGSGSWIGENVCILGVKIGCQCVIGANSVVTRNIPDYCVVVGIPAKIVKRYCFDTYTWRKTDSQGNFID